MVASCCSISIRNELHLVIVILDSGYGHSSFLNRWKSSHVVPFGCVLRRSNFGLIMRNKSSGYSCCGCGAGGFVIIPPHYTAPNSRCVYGAPSGTYGCMRMWFSHLLQYDAFQHLQIPVQGWSRCLSVCADIYWGFQTSAGTRGRWGRWGTMSLRFPP